MSSESERYDRQQNVLPDERRIASRVLLTCARHNPSLGSMLLAGAAAMGVPAAGSDWHGKRGGHWLVGRYPSLFRRLNPAGAYEHFFPDDVATDAARFVAGASNAWGVVVFNDPGAAATRLYDWLRADVDAPVLLVLSAPGGVLVCRCSDPDAALRFFRLNLAAERIEPGPPEMAILAAGLALNEIMLGRGRSGGDDANTSDVVGFYSLHRPRRVVTEDEPAALLAHEIAKPPKRAGSLRGLRLAMVGAGALANWAAIPLAIEGCGSLTVFDGDPEVASHNLNRQVLLVDGVGRGAKVAVFERELATLGGEGFECQGVQRFVRQPDDIDSDDLDALICLPDNDEARFVSAEAASQRNIPLAAAGSSATGGQAVVCQPGRACYRCVVGGRQAAGEERGSQSCALVDNDAVVTSNMIAAGLVMSECRVAVGGGRTANVRFVGDGSPNGNRLVRMISDPHCTHQQEATPVTAS